MLIRSAKRGRSACCRVFGDADQCTGRGLEQQIGALGYSSVQIWLIIVLLALGTFALRFSFLAILGDRTLPPFLLRLLRYTPVAVIPGMVTPLVLWPAATGSEPDPLRLAAAAATLFVGVATRNVIWAILAGAVVLIGGLRLTGQL